MFHPMTGVSRRSIMEIVMTLRPVLFLLSAGLLVAVIGSPTEGGVLSEATRSAAVVQEENADARITGQARAAMERLRIAYRSAVGFSIRVSGHWTDPSGTISPVRDSLLIAASGDLKLLSPTRNLTLLRGVAYADSPFFPGYIIKTRVPRELGASIATLESIWPLAPLPLEARLRLSSSIDSAFAPMLEAIGPEGVVDLSAGAWPDGTPAQALRFKGGETDIVVWIDPASGFVRGIRGRIAGKNGVTTIDEGRETNAVERAPHIVVATTGRVIQPSFAALRKAWDGVYSSPLPPGGG